MLLRTTKYKEFSRLTVGYLAEISKYRHQADGLDLGIRLLWHRSKCDWPSKDNEISYGVVVSLFIFDIRFYIFHIIKKGKR